MIATSQQYKHDSMGRVGKDLAYVAKIGIRSLKMMHIELHIVA